MDTSACPTHDWPSHNSLPAGLTFASVSINNEHMKQAFAHAMKHQALQAKSQMRAVTSVLVAADGTLVYGVAGELCDTVTDKSKDDITYHAEAGTCERMQSDGNVDYDKCPGCKHSRHSERSAIFKALRDGIVLKASEIYLYGQWWVCEPCARACAEAGVAKIYLINDARDLFDRSREGQADRLKVFQNTWGAQ